MSGVFFVFFLNSEHNFRSLGYTSGRVSCHFYVSELNNKVNFVSFPNEASAEIRFNFQKKCVLIFSS